VKVCLCAKEAALVAASALLEHTSIEQRAGKVIVKPFTSPQEPALACDAQT
jgi:hypothetical protein